MPWLAGSRELLRVLATDSGVGAVAARSSANLRAGSWARSSATSLHRYARIIKRRWQALVLSGTGTLFRVSTLREIGRERGGRLPGIPGQFYSQRSITEDDEITLAVKTLGFRCLCPPECETITEVMPDWARCGRSGCAGRRGRSATFHRTG